MASYLRMCISLLILSAAPLVGLSEYETSLVRTIPAYAGLASEVRDAFESLDAHEHAEQVVLHEPSPNALFEQYPALRGRLSYMSLGDLPTPVHHCTTLQAQFPTIDLYVKHDGVTGNIGADGRRAFGGNKLRKLQYLLADAIAHGHDTVLTFGCVGSNHALQTAVCAKALCLKCICMLKPQPSSYVVRRNLLLQQAYGAQLVLSNNNAERVQATIDLCASCKMAGRMLPYIIYTGGSVARGAIGYVEAAFELKEQIRAGTMPQPDHIYVTCGSGGTAAGLLLGCKAAGISTKFHLVPDEPSDVHEIRTHLHALIEATNTLLRSYDPTFPQCTVSDDEYEILDTYTGDDYGQFTPEGIAAIRTMHEAEGIRLDGVYSGKCCSAL